MTNEREEWLALTVEEAIEPDLPICDAHHHIWDRPNDRYLIGDLMNDLGSGHRVVKTVFVECRAMYRKSGPAEMRPVGETEFVQGVAEQVARQQSGQIEVAAGIVGHADLTLGSRVSSVLEAHITASKDRFRGIRYITTWIENPGAMLSPTNAPKGLLLAPEFREGFACLQRYGLSFDAWLYYPQLADLVDLARAFPDTPIIMNHIGGILGIGPYAGKRDEVFRDWQHGIASLASCPNVTMKLGGLGMPRTGFGWHEQKTPPTSAEIAEGIAPYFEWCVEQFGIDRCMFESNFPVDKISYSYTVLWNAFKLFTRDFSSSERNALFHDTAVKAYRL